MLETTTLPRTISFACPGCGKRFSVPSGYAGRKANCKFCHGPIVVPAAPETAAEATIPSPSAPQRIAPLEPVSQEQSPKLPMRTRRLIAEARQIEQAFSNSPLIKVASSGGDPPEVYQVEYRVKGLRKGWFGRPRVCSEHRVEIRLTSDYPRLAPQCKMLTPIFHPNIDAATICVGDHWTAGERLVDLIIRIGEMIAYQAYNIKSPLDGQAAMWADLHANRLPIDARVLSAAEMS